ncbi:phosphate-induced protein 1 [Gongronella butleri]|nr:phosphate-induced protein 1 [Gongronella butleri]
MFIALLFCALALATGLHAQQQTTNSTVLNPVATQYGSSFKNAGGNVLSGYVNAYVVFYGNWTSDDMVQQQTTFLNFIDGISSTSWFSILGQYKDANGGAVTGPLNLAAAMTDSGSAGQSLTDNNAHKTIILNAVSSGYLSSNNQLDTNGIYILMLGPDVSDSQMCQSYCSYNFYSDQFQYVVIGYPARCPTQCMPPKNAQNSPNKSPGIDAAITVLSHELQDVLTDPRLNAWVVQNNQQNIELGDFCSGNGTAEAQWFANTQPSSNGGVYNVEFNNAQYLVQSIYSQAKNTCLVANQ